MATLVVEDGTGLATANTLASLAEALIYMTDRANEDWSFASDAERTTALIAATDYSELRWGGLYKGCPEFPTVQALSFPRLQLYDRNGYAVTGVPTKVKNAIIEYAAFYLANGSFYVTPTVDASGVQVVRERTRVGPIDTDVTYQDGGAVNTTRAIPMADQWLAEYVRSGAGLIRA